MKPPTSLDPPPSKSRYLTHRSPNGDVVPIDERIRRLQETTTERRISQRCCSEELWQLLLECLIGQKTSVIVWRLLYSNKRNTILLCDEYWSDKFTLPITIIHIIYLKIVCIGSLVKLVKTKVISSGLMWRQSRGLLFLSRIQRNSYFYFSIRLSSLQDSTINK